MSIPNTITAREKSQPAEGLWMVQVLVSEIGPDDVLIRVKKTGICGTDIHIPGSLQDPKIVVRNDTKVVDGGA